MAARSFIFLIHYLSNRAYYNLAFICGKLGKISTLLKRVILTRRKLFLKYTYGFA